MRRIVLDTETTGLEPEQGHRIIEIACLELHGRRPTGRHFHRYVNPERDIDFAASQVHGLTAEDLADKPRFADIADEFLAFVEGAELLIHNAAFDVGFLDYELSLLGEPARTIRALCGVEDSLGLARQRFPGQRNSLDALCRRLGVDNSHRHLHGALLDAQILVDVYLALTSGQGEIGFAAEEAARTVVAEFASAGGPRPRITATAEDLAAHDARLAALRKKAGGRVVWDALLEEDAPAEALPA